MKKFFVGIAAGALAAAMCMSVAACGGGDTKPDAKKIKGYEVSEEQWVAAFSALDADDAVYTVQCGSEQTTNTTKDLTEEGRKLSGSSQSSGIVTIVINGFKQSMKGKGEVKYSGDYAEIIGDTERAHEGKIEIEQYGEVVDGTTYFYSKDEEGKWIKLQDDHSIIESISLWTQYSDKYSSFSYSSSEKGYVFDSAEKEEYDELGYRDEFSSHVVLKFDEEGRFAALYWKYSFTSETATEKTSIYAEMNMVFTYSAEEIVLPVVAE